MAELGAAELAREWDERGAITVRTPLCDDPELLARVQANFLAKFPCPDPPGRVTGMVAPVPEDQALIDVMQHPWFEETAKACLRADRVRFCAAACACSYPQPGTEFSFGEHIDIQYTEAEWEATPRQVIVSFFIWLADVDAERAPLMFRPGSHRLLAAENTRRLARGEERRCAGHVAERPSPALVGPPTVHGASLSDLPSTLPFEHPRPAEGEAGTVTVTTTGLVHGASTNVGSAPRMSMHLTFAADGADIGNFSFVETWEGLKPLLRPERRHIVQLQPMSTHKL